MNKGKNYNSIFFLTTLSVYLGLVLVGGASSPVLAQAALTRDFDIRNEIEFKDDLDKKPDDESKLPDLRYTYFNDLEWLIEDLQELYQIEKFDLDFDSFYFKEAQIVECDLETIRRAVITSQIDKTHNKSIAPAMDVAVSRFENYAFWGDCQLKDELDKKKGVAWELEVSYDQNVFTFGFSVTKESPQKAQQLLDKFNQAYKIFELDEEEPIIKKIYENTSFKSENNQVFIVTHLPRASIDDLLAKK